MARNIEVDILVTRVKCCLHWRCGHCKACAWGVTEGVVIGVVRAVGVVMDVVWAVGVVMVMVWI